MKPDINQIEETIKEYAYLIFGKKRIFLSDDLICRNLGLCDEDLWDMIDYVLDNYCLDKPTENSPDNLSMHENDITFSNLARWIYESKLC
jgi:hypothetical protein